MNGVQAFESRPGTETFCHASSSHHLLGLAARIIQHSSGEYVTARNAVRRL